MILYICNKGSTHVRSFIYFCPIARKPELDSSHYLVLLFYCTSNGTQFFVFKILHEGFFTLKICMRIDIAKPKLDLNFGGEW